MHYEAQGNVGNSRTHSRHVYISTSSFGRVDDQPLRLLAQRGFTFRMNPFGRPLTAEEAIDALRSADGLVAGTEPLTREVLAQANRLRVISRCGAGLDNVDLSAAEELGITVLHTTHAHVDAVAELTLGAMIASLRNIPHNDRTVRNKQWNKSLGQLLQGRTVGVIGLGKVGRALVRLLKPFDVQLVSFDLQPDTAFANDHAIHMTSLDELLSTAEIVTLHIPYEAGVHHLIDRDALAQMRPGAYLINTARGGLIDESALYESLRLNKLGGAFIDTFEREPYRGPLTRLPNAILSPHVGAYAEESRLAMEIEAVENLLRYFTEEIPR